MQVSANEPLLQAIGLSIGRVDPASVTPGVAPVNQGGTCTSQLRDGSSSDDKTVKEAWDSLRGQRIRVRDWV